MNHCHSSRVWVQGICLALIAAGGMIATVGCEVDSWMDPSVVGRWERTPTTVPILDRLDIIDEPAELQLPVTPVRAEDLIPDVREYVIGSGDLVTVTVFELIVPGVDAVQTRRVDETGRIRLPEIGEVKAAGATPSQLEDEVRNILERKGILRDAQVSVVLQESRQNTYSVIGAPVDSGTAIGTYVIPKPEFRLLEALALARGVPGRTRRLLVFRQTELTAEAAGEVGAPEGDQPGDAPIAPTDPTELIDDLMGGIDESAPEANNQPEDRPAPPAGVESGLDPAAGGTQWVEVDGKWVQAGPVADGDSIDPETATLDELGRHITQRIIEVPYDRLINGDMRYNIIVRPGDVIRVPDQAAGFVYIMGQINRPGAYTVPGEQDLTLKQLIASAGNLGGLAIPERVDLVRRIDAGHEAMVRLNLRAIFDGTEPDIFLKPNDLINVGTNFMATPIAIVRNGFRVTYGFGFILDRNFNTDVFGSGNL